MHMNAKTNEYQKDFPNFERTPKAVIAAVAYSLAMRLSEDDPARAEKLLRDEWRVLHQNNIVPQVPPNAGNQRRGNRVRCIDMLGDQAACGARRLT
jgi:hypothetical protein